MKLTELQAMRLYYALYLTMESLVACEVPRDQRPTEIAAVANELLEFFEKGEQTPGSPTEMIWKRREQAIIPG